MLKPLNKYISINDAVKNESGEIYIYGDITDTAWWDEEVSPKKIKKALDNLGSVKNLDIHINSYGGSCIAGNAIISILDTYRTKNNTKINVYVEGIAASMGSGIASCGDTVYMADNALYMIHSPWTVAVGNADELQKSIELLDKVEDTLVRNYMRKFNGTEDELRQMMADEVWMTADEAREYGFVDEIVNGVQVAASAKGIKIGNQVFENKVADMIKNKYPNIKIKEEEKKLTYDEKLMDYGIDEECFGTLSVDSAKILEIVDLVKDSIKPEPVEEFIGKDKALEFLGCEDITAEEVLDYAKAGMNPEPPNTEDSEKVKAYDKIMSKAKENAIASAIRAKGDSYNEGKIKKILDVLTYDEILEQDMEWQEEAKMALNAGKRVSQAQSLVENAPETKLEDYKF